VEVQVNRENPVEIVAEAKALVIGCQVVVLVDFPPPVEELIEFRRYCLLFFYFKEVALLNGGTVFERALKHTEMGEYKGSARKVLAPT